MDQQEKPKSIAAQLGAEITALFADVHSSVMADYGQTKVGTYHIWSNTYTKALCGRQIEGHLKYKDIRPLELCSSCNKSNQRRYALFDILPHIFVGGCLLGLAAEISRLRKEKDVHKNNND